MIRDAFTMIELIFIIVILGILAAVGLPKFVGVAESADATRCKAFVGTLNRTVSHSLWADAFFNDRANLAISITDTALEGQIEFLENCGTAAQYAVAATTETSFIKRLHGVDYNITGFKPTATTPAKWIWELKE